MKAQPLVVYLPDTRGVSISQFGKGSYKLGMSVFTYSRLPGDPRFVALGAAANRSPNGTCPGASSECLSICYAARPVAERGAVYEMWARNSATEDVPAEMPEGCTLLRLHIAGDFSSVRYIDGWRELIARHPHVTVWAYTRSWRVQELLPALERIRALPNVQIFASIDKSVPEMPPNGWRRAWIGGDPRAHDSLVCPEQTGAKPDCERCRYCFDGRRADVTFLEH